MDNLLAQWLQHRKEGLSKGWDKSLAKNYLFDLITTMDKSRADIVTGDVYEITADMIGSGEGDRDAVAFRWLHTMHVVISAYPSHFSEDASGDHTLHSSENWFRALMVLRFCQQLFVGNEHTPISNARRSLVKAKRPALVPYWLSEIYEEVNGDGSEVDNDGEESMELADDDGEEPGEASDDGEVSGDDLEVFMNSKEN